MDRPSSLGARSQRRSSDVIVALAGCLRAWAVVRIFPGMSLLDARVPKVGDELPDPELVDEGRRSLRLSELYAKGPLVLVVYRGEWSAACRQQLCEYRDNALSFRKAGARLAALSVDEPAIAAFLRAERGLPFPLLCDPSRAAVEALGLLERGVNGGVARPATLVIDRAGRVRSRSIDSDERRASPDAMLLFIKRGGASGARPARARLHRALVKLRSFESQLVNGLRALGPGKLKERSGKLRVS